MGFFESILALLKSIFSGGAKKEQTQQSATQTESATTTTATNPNNVEGTQMRTSVFNVMVAGEKNQSSIEAIKKEMAEKDAVGTYPYTISTDCWLYTITKPAEPYFSQYGTQYTANQKHK